MIPISELTRAGLKQVFFFLYGNKISANLRAQKIQNKREITIVLNLHRVNDHDGSAYRPLNPALFDELLNFTKKHFDVGSFPIQQGKPSLVLSFDDGYRDFIDVAMPIMDRHKVTCNQNIIPACVEYGMPPLNVVAQDFVGKAPKELVDKLDLPGFDKTGPNLGLRMSRFIKAKRMSEQGELSRILLPQFFNCAEFEPTPMMTLNDVKEAARYHNIGGHSYDHASMGAETDEYFVKDVQKCQKFFSDQLDFKMDTYAFPNGSHRPEQITVLKEAGIKNVLLVEEDFSRGASPWERFTFDANSIFETRFKSLGGTKRIPA